MTDLSNAATLVKYRPRHRVRLVTAASLFDGHDASINIMRRLLQAMGAEVIHLGHNRSVDEVVTAALDEDVQGIAISSYQGGHLEYFRFMLQRLREQGGQHIRVFGGGGGVIIADEIRQLHEEGVRIYSPEDGQRMGLAGMCGEILVQCDTDLCTLAPTSIDALQQPDPVRRWRALAGAITALEAGAAAADLRNGILDAAAATRVPVLGVTGTGGAGKSSLTDELVRRIRMDQDDRLSIAIISIDPSRRRTGGALLGDRIRMNAIGSWQAGARVYMRSLATREAGSEVSAALPDALAACKVAGFDLVLVETSGIGQGDAAIVPLVDLSLYVMTPEYGAASQLEKIDMLDFADFVAINKFDRTGAPDALREVSKQVQRNRADFSRPPSGMPVFGTVASRFNDDGVTALYQAIAPRLAEQGLALSPGRLPKAAVRCSSQRAPMVPAARTRYLAEIAHAVRSYKKLAVEQARLARERQQLSAARAMLSVSDAGAGAAGMLAPALAELERLAAERESRLDAGSRDLLSGWPALRDSYRGEEQVQQVRGRDVHTRLAHASLSGSRIPKVALPAYEDDGELLKWLLLENVPGRFPYTAGVFAFRRESEDPTRMFAGEGDAFRTNRRFHLLSAGMPAKRLSTAFDSVTLYGNDPDPRPDIYGKVGNSGVSIATLDDMKVLYSGFDLTAPDTSVSMTINGPAPTILAMFLNTAIDQKLDAHRAQHGRDPSGDEAAAIRAKVLRDVRGTVQADILKEDQGQNTCIFSTGFSLKLMGDIQQYFVRHQVRNFYSVSISGYHIAEAGANPISQLAFTLANGFTYVECYLARGMSIDQFAPNLSFFFSNGMDPEFTVLGRVARRIWAVAMRDRYGADERSQKLKYHCQTSGRSLHAQEIDFNDIRTTLQALIATYDNANSLHTNAFDEAITTPTEASVRRAMAIQLIVNREWGLAKNENPNQGSFVIEELTELVEEAVLKEFEAISERGGVLGAMELGYQRGKIQDESLHYETLKHSGQYPIVGVNTFRAPASEGVAPPTLALARSTDQEKAGQLARLRDFQAHHAGESGLWLDRLRQAAIRDENLFEVLIDAVRHCSLGQISNALFEVGGQYRRSM
jgi:isobutyryl-CoA mutase